MDAFQAIADPSRRKIIESLFHGERSVNELVEQVAIQQSGVSRHLRLLSEAGLVTVRPDAQRRLYSLRPEPFHQLDAWLSRYRSFWEARLDRFAVALDDGTRKRPKKKGPKT